MGRTGRSAALYLVLTFMGGVGVGVSSMWMYFSSMKPHPRGGGPDRKGATAWQAPIRRAREQAPICDPGKLEVASKVRLVAASATAHADAATTRRRRLGFTGGRGRR